MLANKAWSPDLETAGLFTVPTNVILAVAPINAALNYLLGALSLASPASPCLARALAY